MSKATEVHPTMTCTEWIGRDPLVMRIIAELCPVFTPPTITDWTEPVLNPNWKGKP